MSTEQRLRLNTPNMDRYFIPHFATIVKDRMLSKSKTLVRRPKVITTSGTISMRWLEGRVRVVVEHINRQPMLIYIFQL